MKQFPALRLTLVSQKNDNADAQHLAQALFGILMLLPQTEAFNLLKNRLQCVPNYWGRSVEKLVQFKTATKTILTQNQFQKFQQIN